MKTKPCQLVIGVAWLVAGASAAIDNTAACIHPPLALKIEAPQQVVSECGEVRQGQSRATAEGGASSSRSGGIFPVPRTVNVPAQWRSLALGHGVLTGVDCRGQLQTATENTDWIRRDTGIPFAFHSVAFGKGRFVVVGNEGAIVTSEDGATWTSREAGSDERLRGVTWADGWFVAVGYAGTILTSRDGISWIQRDSGTKKRLQAVAHGLGTLVAVGWDGTIVASTNGVHWSKQRSGTQAHLQRVTWANNAFVARGCAVVLTSIDGNHWRRAIRKRSDSEPPRAN